MSSSEVKGRLRRWGAWASGGAVLGYPRMSALVRINCGGRATSLTLADQELLRTDQIVARSELRLRKILIRQYCTLGSIREKAARSGMSKSTYYDLLEEARWYVHTEYEKPDIAVPDNIWQIQVSVGIFSPAPQRRYENGSG